MKPRVKLFNASDFKLRDVGAELQRQINKFLESNPSHCVVEPVQISAGTTTISEIANDLAGVRGDVKRIYWGLAAVTFRAEIDNPEDF